MPHYVRNREELEHLIVTMHIDGWSKRALAGHFKIGRNTVRRILRKNQTQREEGHDVLNSEKKTPRKSKLDSYVPIMQGLLEKYSKITGVRLYEELKAAGFTGGSTIVTDRLRQIRPRSKKKPVVRFETDPGKQGQMDWSPYTINFKRTGKAKVICFSYILGFSRRHYIDFTTNRNFFTLIRRHQDAFNYFGGLPLQCLYDNEKTVVLRWEAGHPVFNPAFVSFITHYHCKPVACRPGRPETKGKIEAPFLYVENNLLNARDFQDLEDLRGISRWWLANKSDLHKHDTTGHPPLELFMQDERSRLQPLPAHPYDSAEVILSVCRCDGFIELDTNLYSVPYEYVADILTIKATEHDVLIYSPDLEQIACHERLPKLAGKSTENPDHRKSKKVRYGLESIKDTFLSLGPEAESFLVGLKEKHPHNCGFHARSILALKEKYHSDDINKALNRATRYYAFDGKAVERILAARAKPRTLESFRNQEANKMLKKVLPEIKQRPLDEYCQLLSNDHQTKKDDILEEG
ncbi:MAG: IS21 family transposase [Deltaproteobacteria bacterium]|nr:IS21 family transposase [Deltaproteobacteria bacterium]